MSAVSADDVGGAPTPGTLCRLALRGLQSMWDPERETLFTWDLSAGEPSRVAYLAERYTLMCALGVHEAAQAGLPCGLDATTLLLSGLSRGPRDALDHLGMALWADAAIRAGGVADRVVPALLRAAHGELGGVVGREVAWALTGLARHMARGGAEADVRAAGVRLRDLGLRACRRPGSGLFDHFAGGSPLLRVQALFSTQIYWVYALSAWGRAAGDEEAVVAARACADALIARRDGFGGWAWRYHSPSGRVTERWPVYSVHQSAMAPMALRELAAALGEPGRHDAAVGASVRWLRDNELAADMIDADRGLILRAIRRRRPWNRLAYRVGWATSWAGLPSPIAQRPWALHVNRTCRPYELGWVLHAWSDRAGGACAIAAPEPGGGGGRGGR